MDEFAQREVDVIIRGAADEHAQGLCPEHGTRSIMSVWGLTVLFAGVLLASFVMQWTTHRVADWKQFSFYDPGTILKGDLLLEKGYVPTVDFGYTHGLISLLYGRAGFALLGRTPWAFLALTLLAEMGMAWALARIVAAVGLAENWRRLLFVLIGLPMAVMPAYLTLTHPLEAMLILLALAAQAEGRPGGGKAQALGLMTVCLFVKPSMAYVYGFVLVVLIVWEERGRWGRIAWDLLPAAAALVMMLGALSVRFGVLPVMRTLLPFTGARTYATTGFGFFGQSGRAFWMPSEWWQYVGSPTGIFLLAASGCLVGAVIGSRKLLRGRASEQGADNLEERRKWELLATIGILHTAFLLGFYGWTGSWTYYSYLPALGLGLFAMLIVRGAKVQAWVFTALALVMLLSHGEIVGWSYDAWTRKTPSAAAGEPGGAPGLWRYETDYAPWVEAAEAVGDHKTLVMTNGYMVGLPPTMEMPDAWFPEPGIPTASEVARVKAQVANAEYVILWNEYGAGKEHGDLRLWGLKEFAQERGEFEEVPGVGGAEFTVLKRVVAATEPSEPQTREDSK